MNWQILTESSVVEDMGWTLFISLWQIALVACVLMCVLRILKNVSPNLRYAASVLALVVSVTIPVITFVQLSGNSTTDLFKYDVTKQIGRDDLENFPAYSGGSSVARANDPLNVSEKNGATAFLTRLREYLARKIPSILPVAVGLWLLGVALFSFRLGGGIWQLRRYKMSGVESVDANWQQRFTLICQTLKIDRHIKLLQSAIIETPIAIGFFKPLIIVPVSVFLQMRPHELETIIAHELIHIRRYDPLVNILQSVIEVLFFYHPGVWWISAQIRREREFAADNAVMEIFGDSHTVYATALANLEEIRLRADQNMPSIATAANGGNLMQRMEKILKIKTEMTRANSAWSAVLTFVLILVVLAVVFSFNPSSFVNAQTRAGSRKVAIGFVSIPPLDRSDNPPKDSDATARLMIAKLTQYKIPAIGFVNGSSISDGEKTYPVRANIVRLWRDAGFEIGIGGYNHLSFFKTDYDEYVANTEKNQRIVKPILVEKNLPLRYYSYPYLNTGKSNDEHLHFEDWLDDHSLRSMKYTIDNNEWMYSYAYDLARNDNDVNTMKEIRVAFIDYMTQMFEHYETYSSQMFGRDIAQTMVLTPSRLVTDSADDLFGMIRNRGYSFVPIDEAQADEAYKTEEHFVGNSGISWFERWTMAKGKPLLEEPKVNDLIRRMWNRTKSTK
jgi:beta-lactamase regulating signal transducer with metallopeptidase domain/peptidoglycan/xylan/chitin deacetylase (PgdA/CDA1 family)